jgi:hypothetical protein
VRYGLWMRTLGALIVAAAACGTDRAGGGGSETHWVACESPSECEMGFDCVEGKCSPVVPPEPGAGGDGGDAGGGGVPGTGGRAETGGAPTTGGAETGGVVSAAGAGGTLNCVAGSFAMAGAISFPEAVPPVGRACPPGLEDFEICTQVRDSGEPYTVLSRCVGLEWTIIENPSTCEPIGRPSIERECNYPNAFTGMCCDAPKYCPQYDILCDGVQWYR